MAAPTILSEAWTTPSTSNATTYAITVPTGSADEVVECEVGSTSNGDLSVSSGSGWRLVRQWKFASGLSGALFRKNKGTAGADSLTVASSTSARFNAHTVRLPAGTRTFASPIATATATGTNSNPPLVDHLKSRETLYTAVRWGAGTVVPSAGPSGYGTRVNNAATSGGVSQSYAYKTATSGSDDPGTFTSSSALWGSITIARWIDLDSPQLVGTKAKLAAGTADIVVLADGDSQEAGAAVLSGSTDTMGSNVSSICRNAVRAAYLQSMPGSRASFGGSGGLTTTAGVKAWDTRVTSDASHALSQAIGAYTLGGSGHTLGTSGHKLSFAPGESFDRIEIGYFRGATSPVYTVDVNGGSPQNISGMTGADGVGKATFNLSGNSAAVININGTGAGGYFLWIRAWSTATKRVHFMNLGWYGCTSTNAADNSAYFSALKAQALVAADLTYMTVASNDPNASIPLATTLDNLRAKWLVALSTGECVYTIPNYFAGGNEAAQDALWDVIEDAADELGVAVNRLTRKPGYETSYAATVTAGNLVSPNSHMTPQGHLVAGLHDLAMIEPPIGTSAGVATVSGAGRAAVPGVGTAAGSSTASGDGATALGTEDGDGVAAGGATVSGVGAALARAAGSIAGAATAAAIGAVLFSGAGSAPGAATVAGVGATMAQAAGSSFGVGAVSGVGATRAAGVGTATGAASVSGAGSAVAVGVGTAGGAATVSGVGSDGSVLWTPIDEPSSLEAWHDPSNAAGLTVVSGKVTLDSDLSGNGNDDTQGFGGAEPSLSAAALNGLDIEAFAGGQTFQSPLVSDPAVRVITFLMNRTAGGGNQVIFGGPTGNYVLQHRSDYKLELDKGGVALLAVSNIAVPAGSWAVVTCGMSTSGTVFFRINGADAGSFSISPFSWAGTPGGDSSTGGNGVFSASYKGGLAERTKRNNLSLSAIEKDEAYIAWHWGLEGDLDAAHPYKTAPPMVGGGSSTEDGVGSATGSASVSGVGAAVKVGVGSSAASSTASGVATARAAGVGSAAGTSTTQGITGAAADIDGVGSAAGGATVSGIGSSLAKSAGSSAGVATASAVGSTRAAGVGSSAGVSTASAVGTARAVAVGSATAGATVSGAGSVATSGSATGSATGVATVNGVAAALFAGQGVTYGQATGAGVGSTLAAATGSSAGAATVSGAGQRVSVGVGSASASSAVSGVASGLSIGAGSAQGLALVQGYSGALLPAVGTAAGSSTAAGVGSAEVLDINTPPERSFSVAAETRKFTVMSDCHSWDATTINGSSIPSVIKDPQAKLDYELDWTSWLVEGDSVSTLSWTVPEGLVKVSESTSINKATVWISGGEVGSRYTVTCHIVTTAGREDDRSLSIAVRQR